MADRIYKTIKPSGQGGDYTSIEACLHAQEQDYVTNNKYLDAEIGGDWSGGSDTTSVTAHNASTSETCCVNVYTDDDNEHSGEWDTSVHRLETENAHSMAIYLDYINVNRVQMRVHTITADWKRTLHIMGQNATNTVSISNCILRAANSSTYESRVLYAYDTDLIIYFWNNLCYDVYHLSNMRVLGFTSASAYVYNNTIIGDGSTQYGIYAEYGSTLAINNIIQECVDGLANPSLFHANTSHNVTDSGALDGSFGASWSTGTTSPGTPAYKCYDTSATFITDGVQVGSCIQNTKDYTYSYVVAVESETTLLLNDDIFTNNEGYKVFKNMFGSVTFAGSTYKLESSDTVARNKGLSNPGSGLFSDDFIGTSRPQESIWDVGCHEYAVTGETVILYKFAITNTGKSINVKEFIILLKEALQWAGKNVTPNIHETVQLTKESNIFTGKSININIHETIQATKMALLYTGKSISVFMDEVIDLTRQTLQWVGKGITVIQGGAPQVIDLYKMSIQWVGKTITVNIHATISMTKSAITFTGKSITANIAQTIQLTKQGLQWAGKVLYINETIHLTKNTMLWAGKNISILGEVILGSFIPTFRRRRR